MKTKSDLIRIIALLLFIAIAAGLFSSCAELESIGNGTSGEAGEAPNTPPAETEPEVTEPPHSDHVYENGSCTECGASEGIVYSVNRDTGTAEVKIAAGCKTEKIVVAAYYKDCPVTHIAARAFENAKKATEIILPDTVTTLEEEALAYSPVEIVTLSDNITELPKNPFKDSPNLKKVIAGECLQKIGMMAFYNCKSLTEIVLPDTLSVIENSAFEGCKTLTSFTVPKGVTVLDISTFSFCTNLTEINFHDGIKNIKDTCFSHCEKLMYLNNFPSEIEFVSNTAFISTNFPRNEYKNCLYIGNESNPYIVLESCIDKSVNKVEIHPDTRIITDSTFHVSSLSEVVIPDKVITIGNSAFAYSRALKSVSMSDSVINLGENAFNQCISLKDIRLSDSITAILSKTFNGCKALTEIKLPKSAVTIGQQIFDSCEMLTTIHIPKSVKELNLNIYEAPISEIRYEGTKEEWMKIQYLLEQYSGFTVYCNDGEISY